MTTEQEFKEAIKMVIACKSTLTCGCQVDEQSADWLYYQCKTYVEAYRKRFK